MEKSSCLAFGARIYYRPIEAAVRWAGLLRFEPRILETLGPRAMPEPNDFPRWPLLRLFSERIFDALALYAVGIPTENFGLVSGKARHPCLTPGERDHQAACRSKGKAPASWLRSFKRSKM